MFSKNKFKKLTEKSSNKQFFVDSKDIKREKIVILDDT